MKVILETCHAHLFLFQFSSHLSQLSSEGWFYHVNTRLIITSKGDGFGLCLGTVPEKYIKKISSQKNRHFGFKVYTEITAGFQKFVGPSDRAGRKSQGLAILPSILVRVSDNIFCLLFCFAPEIGNATDDHGQLGIIFCFK